MTAKKHLALITASALTVLAAPGHARPPIIPTAGNENVREAVAKPRPKPSRGSDGIASIIEERGAVPKVKPKAQKPNRQQPAAPEKATPAKTTPAKAPPPPRPTENAAVKPLAATHSKVDSDRIAPVSGSLESGLEALKKNDYEHALAIRNGMKRSLDRKILDWQIARSGARQVSSAFINRFMANMGAWPDARLLRIRAEQAMLREKPSAGQVFKAFNGAQPISTRGTILLARAYVSSGHKSKAAPLIRDVWRTRKLSKTMQAAIAVEFGKLLSKSDHKARIDTMLYEERVNDAQRLSRFVSKGQNAVMNARSAVIRRRKNAGALLQKVPKNLRNDPSYIFARVQYLRRSKKWKAAAEVLLAAPRDPAKLVDPDEWWVERRLVSRKMLELGQSETAYRLAAGHSAQSPAKYAEAEFHAGWYALRFVRDPKKAMPHFKRIVTVGKSAITRSRGYYWLGRAADAAGDKATAKKHYQQAAKFGSAYYGQLARAQLGESSLGLGAAPRPSKSDRAAFSENQQVKAISRLAGAGEINRTLPLFLNLSKTLPNPGQAALLTALAEKHGKHRYALIAGKQIARRWNEAAALAFPLNAIPRKTKITRGVEKPMVYAIARQESAFDPAAVSHAGARGLLQLLPSTAKATARRNKIKFSKTRLTTDAAYNATLGAAHLGELVGKFNGSYIMTFAGYNAGSRRVGEWVARFGDPRSRNVDAIDWIERIPFTETRNYVQRITENLQVYRARLNGSGLQINKDLKRGD